LAGVTVGTVTWQGGSSSSSLSSFFPPLNVADPNSVWFGWEVSNFDGNGASVYFRVLSQIILSKINIDVAYMLLSTAVAGTGFADLLCRGSVSRGQVPRLPFEPLASRNFGSAVLHNPHNLPAVCDATPLQDVFYSIILTSWVPSDGTASATYRQVYAKPSLALESGDYLIFQMQHTGAAGDAEMQIVLNYA
jgi:hypothetical protein